MTPGHRSHEYSKILGLDTKEQANLHHINTLYKIPRPFFRQMSRKSNAGSASSSLLTMVQAGLLLWQWFYHLKWKIKSNDLKIRFPMVPTWSHAKQFCLHYQGLKKTSITSLAVKSVNNCAESWKEAASKICRGRLSAARWFSFTYLHA